MNLELLLPFAGAHAVQNVAVAAEWQGELSDQTLLRIHSLQDDFKAHFPKVDLQKMMQINLTPSEAVTQSSSQLGGVIFQQVSQLGAMVRQLQVNRQSCVFVVSDYARWEPTLELVMNYFTRIFPIILADKAISTLALQYTDSFTWKDDPDLLDMNEVFKPASPYLPPNAYAMKTPWHAHHGFIHQMHKPVEHERLDNMMINVTDVAGERTIQIIGAHRVTLKKPLRLSTDDYMGVFQALENGLHARNKELLADILSEAVANKISLK